MVEHAKVFIAEDDRDWLSTIRGLLEDDGHSVVASATTKRAALRAISKLEELGVQIATIDGNLDDPADASGADGQEILAAIRREAPDVKTIGLSTKPILGVDVDLRKSGLDKLGDTLRSL